MIEIKKGKVLMKIWPECIPCIIKMSLDVIRTSVKDENQIKRFLEDVLTWKPFRGEDFSITSPEIIRNVWLKFRVHFGLVDPLKTKKDGDNWKALKIYPDLKEVVKKSKDPVLEALKLSILGNSIDSMGDIREFSIEGIVKSLEESWIDLKAVEELRRKVSEVRKILFLGDNCGEIVFDKLFIETLRNHYDTEVVYVTRTIPVLNDALLNDAFLVGMNEVATVMENGIDEPLPGTFLSMASEEVRELVNDSNLVISKGGGNFDTLSEDETLRGKVSFLLRGKCYPSCTAHRVPFGGLIVHHF
ncbi:MAG: damage-control phosphatase ARMT1 family protein [Thermodesulfobacteriota bacterium]